MVQTIILTQANIIGSANSTFKYTFPQTVNFEGEFIAVQQVSLYNSVFNITKAFNNNTLSYTWVDGTVVNITIPDGSYSVFSINTFLQSIFVANNHYVTNATGTQNLYFIELIPNISQYAYQLNLYPISTANTTGYVVPAGSTWTLANCDGSVGGSITPTITIPNNNIVKLLGFNAGTYPNTVISSGVTPYAENPPINNTYSVLSQNAPEINPQPNYLGLCSLVNNTRVIPSQLIYIITPQGEIGAISNNQINNLAFNKIADGNYKDFEFRFTDTVGNPIIFQDPNITIMLVIASKEEIYYY